MLYTVSLTGHGSAARLVAEPFRFFHRRFPGTVWKATLDRTRFIQLKYPESGYRCCYIPGVSFQMQVLEYTQPDSDSVEPITVQFTFTDVPIVRLPSFIIRRLTHIPVSWRWKYCPVIELL